MSTFMGYYILSARAMAGDIQGCLDCVREYWGGMLSLGATTFWEDLYRWMENGAPIDELTGVTEEWMSMEPMANTVIKDTAIACAMDGHPV